MPRKAKSDTVQLRVRVRRDLLNRLEASAKRHKRPLNPEIIARLESSLSEEDLMIRVVEVIREVDSKRTEPKQ